jgi:hypothetical protein
MPNIESLTAQADRLEKSFSHWNHAYLVLVAITAFFVFLTFVAQWVASGKSGELDAVRKAVIGAKDGQLAEEFAHRDERIAKVKADADVSIAEVEAEADDKIFRAKQLAEQIGIDSNRKTEKLRAQNLDTSLKLAEAQKDAAAAQLTLRRNIEYAATPRRIVMGSRDNDEKIRESRFKELEKYAGTYAIILFVNDEEAKLLAFDIRNALVKSGWKADLLEAAATSIPLGYIQPGVKVMTHLDVVSPPGLTLSMPPAPLAVVNLLSLDLGPPVGPVLGVRWDPDVTLNGNPMGLTRYGFKFPERGVVITVGSKPVFEFLLFNDFTQPAPKK